MRKKKKALGDYLLRRKAGGTEREKEAVAGLLDAKKLGKSRKKAGSRMPQEKRTPD